MDQMTRNDLNESRRYPGGLPVVEEAAGMGRYGSWLPS